MTDFEYTEIDGLLYPIIETGMEGLESSQNIAKRLIRLPFSFPNGYRLIG